MHEGPFPYAADTDTTYENFEARCPVCGFWNVFNRATDLKDTRPISFRTVECLDPSCRRQFNINGDLVNPAYHMFIIQCYALKAEKRYSYCIVSLAQAFELFFSHYLYERLVIRPLHTDPDVRVAKDYQSLSDALYSQIESLGYRKLRNVFLHVVLEGPGPASMEEAQRVVASLPALCTDPPDAALSGHSDPAIGQLLLALKGNGVITLRNRVAHQEGYRPTLQEVEDAIKETREVIFPLGARLKVT
jgi:hypothetical protein